ncbi:uncharacterized protein [Arachis hypogaea]|uniref:uncharacterized protein n=1 Tax=Arachis hypogaea TaxID=3818 RepID=UPI003B2169E9
MALTQLGYVIKKIRSDNAPELSLTDFLKSRGSLHQFSCVERPQQNSMVERKSRSSILRWKFPYQLLYNKTPTYEDLKVFGYLVYALTLPYSRNKFSPRAIPAVFLGYPRGYKGYKYDLKNRKFFISRDVIFRKLNFSFKLGSTDSSLPDPFDDHILRKPLEVSLNTPQPFALVTLVLIVTQPLVETPQPLRRSQRLHRAPTYLADYHYNNVPDINNAFLNGDLDKEVYMQLPQGYPSKGEQGEKLACKLNRSIYCLKQASRGTSDSLVMVLVYVDDIIVASKLDDVVTQTQQTLQGVFKLKVLGLLKYFLGLEIAKS